MHTHLTYFLRINKISFSHQFGFRNGYSTNHALTSLTEIIRKTLDEDKFACGVCIDLQKAFDTVDHGVLFSKLNHCRQQYTASAHLKSDLCSINSGSLLGPTLSLLYINDLNQAIYTLKVHHFADDTNFLYTSQFFKKIK